MKAKSIKGNSPEEIKTALEKSMADGFKPKLAIIFLSITQDRSAISKIFDDKDIEIYGATSNGEFTEEGISKGAIAVLLLEINRDHFKIMFSRYDEKNFRETTRTLAKEALETS